MTDPYELGPWRIDPGTCEVRDGTRSERLEPRAMAVLNYLAVNSGRTVRREEMLDEIWKTRFVVEEALTKCISQLRWALKDEPRNPKYIQTVPKLGYRLLVKPVPCRVAGDAAEEIVPPPIDQPPRSAAAPVAEPEESGRSPLPRTSVTIALTIAALALAYVTGAHFYEPRAREEPIRFAYGTPSGSELAEFTAAPFAITPDGQSMIIALGDTYGARLWRRRMSSSELMPIIGSEGGTSPFVSPNGQWIAFAAEGRIKRISIAGGPAQVITDAEQFFGGCWVDDETIVFAPRFARGLWTVRVSGGRPEPLTRTTSEDTAHIWPTCLPDRHTVLFSQWRGGSQVDESSIGFVTVDGKEHGVVLQGGYFPRYLASLEGDGHLLFARLGTLMSVPFDIRSRRTYGTATALFHGVLANVNSQVAFFETSNTPHLVYVQGRYEQPERRLFWVNREGETELASELRAPFSSPRISADGRRVVTWLQDEEVGVWALDLGRDRLVKVSRSLDDHSPVWSPDGQRVAFDSSRSGHYQLYVAPVDGRGEEVQLTRGPGDRFVNAWLPDGRLAFTEQSTASGGDLWLIESRAGAEPQPLLRSPFSESEPAFSADGRWMAYVSDESGRKEVYLQRFPPTGPRVPVSRDGGEEPQWSRQSSELYFRHGRNLLAVQVSGSRDEPMVSDPKVLFSGSYHYNLYSTATYDVGADGRFLMVQQPPAPPRNIQVVLFMSQAMAHAAGGTVY